MTPIEKKVSTKKITRSPLASPIAAVSCPNKPAVVHSASASVIRNVPTKPRMNLGNRFQISLSCAFCAPARGLM